MTTQEQIVSITYFTSTSHPTGMSSGTVTRIELSFAMITMSSSEMLPEGRVWGCFTAVFFFKKLSQRSTLSNNDENIVEKIYKPVTWSFLVVKYYVLHLIICVVYSWQHSRFVYTVNTWAMCCIREKEREREGEWERKKERERETEIP